VPVSAPFSRILLQHLMKEILAFVANVVFGRGYHLQEFGLPRLLRRPKGAEPQILILKNKINNWTTYTAGNRCTQSDARRPVVHAKRIIISADDFSISDKKKVIRPQASVMLASLPICTGSRTCPLRSAWHETRAKAGLSPVQRVVGRVA